MYLLTLQKIKPLIVLLIVVWFSSRAMGVPSAPKNLRKETAPSSPLTVADVILPSAQKGIAYSRTLSAFGGAFPYSWFIEGGSLPVGMTLDAGGRIAGIPTQAGVSTFTLMVQDGFGSQVRKAATLRVGNTYYLAPYANGGRDTNDGLSPLTPWLSPKHPLNCGDVILAAASNSYEQGNFEFGMWGPVNCSPGDEANIAWLKCETFGRCKLNATNQNGMWITSSYWGVQGWEVTALGGQAICFAALPPNGNTSIHHIIFANNIANGCYGAGFQPVEWGSAGIDYFVVIGGIAYNAAQQSAQCGSGISVTSPKNTDTLPGTHIYIGQTFTWNNPNPSSCGGTQPTDGNGVIFDYFDTFNYSSQAVMENNIAFLNGGSGFRVVHSNNAPIFIRNNTAFGNSADLNANHSICGDITTQASSRVRMYRNLSKTKSATGCGSNPAYAFYVDNGDATVVVENNVGFGLNGRHAGKGGGPTFSFAANNMFGVDPGFANPISSNPGAPDCQNAASVLDCVADIIGNFTAQTPAAAGLGYRRPLEASTANNENLFPRWLCNVNLPPDLLPRGCQ